MTYQYRLVSRLLVLVLGLVPSLRADEPAAKFAPPAVGDKAADFALDDLGGQRVSLAGALKNGPVVLVVLRGWPGYQCPFCTRQVAQFRGHANEFKAAGATVIMVYPGPAAELKAHAEEFFKNKDVADRFRLLIDPDFTFTTAYGLRWNAPNETAYPSTFVIDRAGVVRFAKTSKSHDDRADAGEVVKAVGELK